MKKITIIILLSFIGAEYISAQLSDTPNLIEQRVREKVKQLNEYISFMASPKIEKGKKVFYKKQALQLFINCGESFDVVTEHPDSSKDTIRRDGAAIEVSGLLKNSKRKINVKRYFDGLINGQYKPVTIDCIEYVSNDTYLPSQTDSCSNCHVACIVRILFLNDIDRPKGICCSERTPKWYIGQFGASEDIDEATGEISYEYRTCIGDIKASIK